MDFEVKEKTRCYCLSGAVSSIFAHAGSIFDICTHKALRESQSMPATNQAAAICPLSVKQNSAKLS